MRRFVPAYARDGYFVGMISCEDIAPLSTLRFDWSAGIWYLVLPS